MGFNSGFEGLIESQHVKKIEFIWITGEKDD